MRERRRNLICWYPFRARTNKLEIFDEESCFLEDERVIRIKIYQLKEIDCKYDYIILNDVFRLAPELYFKNSHYTLLKKCQKLLKKNGHILLSIDNRFGLRFFSGEPDPFYQNCFFGMRKNEGLDHILFTRRELESLVYSTGFKNIKFYYPYPNHLEPFEIFTDNSINQRSPLSAKDVLSVNATKVFEDAYVDAELREMNIAQYFADSFLVDISNEDVQFGIDYVKISTNRKEEFQSYTILNYQTGEVYKKAITRSGEEHMREIEKNSMKTSLYPQLPYRWIDGKVMCDLLTSSSIKDLMVDDEKRKKILKRIKERSFSGEFRFYKENNGFIKVFGTERPSRKLHWQTDLNIDFIPENVYENNIEWIMLDPEWFFSFPVPEEFVLWRFADMCNWCFPGEKDVIDFTETDEETVAVFKKWNDHFVYEFVGSTPLNYKSAKYVDYAKMCKDYQEVDYLRSYNYSLKADYERITQSTIWKASKPLRTILDMFKRNK